MTLPNIIRYLSLITILAASSAMLWAGGTASCGSGGSTTATVSTIAGSGEEGNDDGAGSTATFNEPDGVTVTDDGTLYITDQGNDEVRQIDSDGTVTTIAGTGEAGYTDGAVATAQFNNPDGITTDGSGNTYVADTGNNVIRKISADGQVTTLAGSGEAGNSNGTGTAAEFNSPAGITIDSSDNLYVADEGNNVVRKITPEGEVTTFAGSGTADYQNGTGTEAAFNAPHGIAVDTSDNIYVTDTNNNRVRKITTEAEVTSIAGNGIAGSTDGPAGSAQMDSPHGIGVDTNGNVYFADENNSSVRKIDTSGQVSTYAGTGSAGSTDGDADEASFRRPRGVAVGWYAQNEGVYICDYGNNKIRKISK